ncbi:ABC transporter permease [Litchfieldia salsa]|uniref:Peptide/nickel transport system permease protein n=1 Tax=Litchfieldia salsa TaxID=930152 RepID=A0A1H0PA95_9BACI|nr:ABC transporter permease subunit [Litchfieldia salsa]SDP01891.1 peptide/nickel transport system permease protein [Litchfieldia salsa]
MRNKELTLGLVLLSSLLLVTFIGPYLPFIDTEFEEGRMRFYEGTGKFSKAPHPPSSEDWLGTDRDGRDLLSLMVLGAKDTLLFMISCTFIKHLLAVPLGLLASKGKGFVYFILSTWNSVLSGIPLIFMAVILFNLPLFNYSGERFLLIVFTVAMLEVGKVGMVFQQQAHSLSNKPYIDAAITIGSRPTSIMFGHYLPVLGPQIFIHFIMDLGRMALLIGQLGVFKVFIDYAIFIGGTPPLVNTSYNWGSLLGDTKNDILNATWIPLFPALAITYVIFTFNILGEGLRKRWVKA